MMNEIPESNNVPPDPTLAKQQGSLDLTPLFILIAAGLIIGIILKTHRPVYTVNDGSRWNTVFYLVEHGTYEFKPDHGAPWAQYQVDEPQKIPPFMTIDMIKIGDKYYSSKPPLLPTCLAGVILLIQQITGTKFVDNPWWMMQMVLILVQVVPFLIFVWLMRCHIHRLSDSPFVRNYCIAAAALATYLTPWCVTLNNHVIAACMTMFAIHSVIRIWYDHRREWYWFALTGFFAAFTAAIELPAGLFAVVLFVALLIKDRKRTLFFGLTAGLVPAIAGMYTNYLVTGSVIPAYLQVGKENGWYNYEGSYWNNPAKMDALSEPKWLYLMQMLIGHHGFFLLTPIFILSLFGITKYLIGHKKPDCRLAAFVFLLSAVIVAFYTIKTGNYGGTCQGCRWLFWLIPLWLLFLPAGVEPLARTRIGRGICFGLIGVSMFSVAGALCNPWWSSWAQMLFRRFGWIDY